MRMYHAKFQYRYVMICIEEKYISTTRCNFNSVRRNSTKSKIDFFQPYFDVVHGFKNIRILVKQPVRGYIISDRVVHPFSFFFCLILLPVHLVRFGLAKLYTKLDHLIYKMEMLFSLQLFHEISQAVP
jgi:hypothetical protein